MSAPPPDVSSDSSSPPVEPPEAPEPPGLEPRTGSGPHGLALVALTVAVVAVLVTPVLVAVGYAATGSGTTAATSDSPRPAAPSVPPPASGTPEPSPSASVPPLTRRPVTCWDGSNAPKISACSEPHGADGLTWVFGSIADQRCGKPASSGPVGVVLRRVCRARLAGGGRALVVYTQWQSTAAAVDDLRGRGLTPAGGRGAAKILRFVSPGGRFGAAYADEPFSYVVTLPAGADPAASTGQVVRARPAKQVRGSR